MEHINRLFIALFSFAGLSLAAQNAAPPDSLLEKEIAAVTVIAEKNRLLSSVPGSAAYIQPKELKSIQALSGNEVFRKVPGLHVVDEEGLGFRANIGIRGLDPDRSANVLILEDGVPVQLNPYGEAELYYTPSMDRMSAVEIVKGSGQIMFGPRTIGGVINYITAEPPAKAETNVSLKGGSGGYFSAQLGYGNSFGNTGLSVNYLYKRADQINVTGFDVHDFTAKFRVVTGPKSVLGVKFQVYNEQSNATYIGLTQGMYERGQYYTVMAPDDQLAIRRYALSATHKYFISKQLKLQTTAFAYTISRNWGRQNFSSSASAANRSGVVWGDEGIAGGAIYMQNETLHRNRNFEVAGIESRLGYTWKHGQLDLGARLLSEKAREQEILSARPGGLSGSLVRDEDRPGQALSGFIQNRFNFTKDFYVTAGLRVEDYYFDRNINLFKTASGTYRDTLITAGSHVSALIPGIGFHYTFSASAGVFGGVHRGFAPPAIKNSLSTAGEVFPLDAQSSWNYELGLRSHFVHGIEGELTAFYLDFDKQVIPVSESSGGSGSGFANAGRTRHEGIEAAIRIDAAQLLHSKYHLYWQGNVTYVQATYNADRFIGADKTNVKGNRLPYSPNWMSTQTIGFTAPWGLELQSSLTSVSSQFTDELNTTAPAANGRSGLIPSYWILDATARYQWPKTRLSLFATVKNLSDERYIASRRPQGIKMGTPRLFIGGVSVTL